MKNEITYRRICNARCGIGAHIEEHRIVNGQNSPSTKPTHNARITQPMKRVNGSLQPTDWDTAIDEIGDILRRIRRQNGPSGIGVYIGESAQRSARSMIRSLAFGVGSGTPHIFSEANMSFGAPLWASEKMIGHAASLMSDLSRAHYIVLLGGEQRNLGWGPFSPGEGHEGWIQHSRKTKKTKVVVADPRHTELAETMDKHLPIRPGSESYLMLGMLTAIVQSGWTDDQFIRDYTRNFDQLKTLLADWKVEDFANLCGIEAAELSGVALSFSRSPMALIHPARQSFQNEAGALGAWAWLAIHAVTANILRPGGLFENKGVIDLFSILTQIKTDKAPKTDAAGYPLLLMQAPATAFPKEISEGALRAVISVSGDPVGRLPNPKHTREAIANLELLVCVGQHPSDTMQSADWVLPSTYAWEQTALVLNSDPQKTPPDVTWSSPLSSLEHQARPAEQILSDLYSALRPGLRGSVWGRHLGLFAQFVARTDLEQWEQKLLSDHLSNISGKWNIVVDETIEWRSSTLESEDSDASFYLHVGDGDRSLWRPSTPDERIELIAQELVPTIQSLSLKSPAPLVLRTGQWRTQPSKCFASHQQHTTIEAHLHPDLGFNAGDPVRIKSKHGECDATVVLDERLRKDVIDLPFFPGSPSLSLLADNGADPIVGSIIMDGIEATVSNL